MLTQEQFEKKITKLKNKEDLHRNLSRRYHEEIDRLLIERNKATVENFIGSYVNYGLNYMKVESQKSTKHGFYIYGKGFYDSGDGFWGIYSIRFPYDDAECLEDLKIITEEEYRKRYQEMVARIQKNIGDV